MGPADIPAWQQAFWYRGSAIPGAPSTAVIAGHISDPLGRPGSSATSACCAPAIRSSCTTPRTGLDVTLHRHRRASYPIEQTTDPGVLTADLRRPVPSPARGPQPSPDGLAHLTLVTCDGTFRNGTHDHRLVVHAVRIS